MVEKYGVKMTKEILPTLVNIVVPVGLSRTSLSRGVQVSLLFCVFMRFSKFPTHLLVEYLEMP